MILRSALNTMGAQSEHTVMIGDRMDTDIKTGMEAGMRTVLVRSGISDDAAVDRHPYRPTRVVDDIGVVADAILDPFGDGHYQG